MERLTHEADFGLEDWEETLFFVKSDPNGAYNILDIAKYQGEPEFDEILKNVSLRLAAYENTGLEPEDFERAFTEDALLKLTGQILGVTPDRIRELAQADRDGRCVVMPCKIGDIVWCIYTGTQGNHPTVLANRFEYGMIPYWGISVFPDKEQAEAALKERENNG